MKVVYSEVIEQKGKDPKITAADFIGYYNTIKNTARPPTMEECNLFIENAPKKNPNLKNFEIIQAWEVEKYPVMGNLPFPGEDHTEKVFFEFDMIGVFEEGKWW